MYTLQSWVLRLNRKLHLYFYVTILNFKAQYALSGIALFQLALTWKECNKIVYFLYRNYKHFDEAVFARRSKHVRNIPFEHVWLFDEDRSYTMVDR